MKRELDRRALLKSALAATTTAAVAGQSRGNAAEKEEPRVVASKSDVADSLKADLLVVGAGSAGWPAALAAARAGARVILVEEDAMPGGQPVDMYVASPCGGPQVGLYQEMLDRLGERHDFSLNPKRKSWYLPSSYIQVILAMLGQEQERLQLICGARAVWTLVSEGSRNRVRGVEIERFDGQRQTIEAAVTIDASGSGIVAAMGGFETMYGRDARSAFGEPFGPEVADHKVQHCTWMFISQQIHQGPAMDFSKIRYAPNESGYGWLDTRGHKPERAKKLGSDLETAMKRNAGIYLHWGSSVVCEDTRDPICIAKAQREAYGLIERDLQILMENGYAVHLAPKLGIRETRRVLGEHVITVNDLKSGKMPDDVIAISDYGLDAWGEDMAEGDRHLPRSGVPYRALVPKAAEGLLIACKSISGTHLAASSYRVQPIMASVGTAAGLAATLAVQKRTGLRDIPMQELQQQLQKVGVLPA